MREQMKLDNFLMTALEVTGSQVPEEDEGA